MLDQLVLLISETSILLLSVQAQLEVLLAQHLLSRVIISKLSVFKIHQEEHTRQLPKVVLMQPKITKVTEILFTDSFTIQSRAETIGQGKLMYIDQLKFLQVLLISVLHKVFHSAETTEDYQIIGLLEGFQFLEQEELLYFF